MSAMAALSADREQELNEAHCAYLEALEEMTSYQDAHPPAWRKLSEMEELGRLEGVCMVMKSRYENAKANRFKVVI